MRILSWNINGIRTLPQYHPWNTLKSCEAILEELKADVICFQEMKTSRAALESNVALPGPFDSFFSFPVSKGGYSGVAVYTDSRTVVPLKAEEGISGKLQPRPPFTPDERLSASYPYAHQIDMMPDEEGNTPSDLGVLDYEGRALVVDFGLFVLINVYCPNETSDARLPFKMNYHYMLQERVRKLIEEERRDVIVLGDINICATPLDHCDGHLASNANCFHEHPARAWFHKWLDPTHGAMIDVVRSFWPERKGMYTCWNTKISARDTNYGTRVDYILITRGLLPWIKHGDIQPSLKGSDHCPIYIDLHDEIVLESGEKCILREALRMDKGKRQPPRLAAKFWEEFSGKQTKLSTFFGKRENVPPIPQLQPFSPSPEASTLPELSVAASTSSQRSQSPPLGSVNDSRSSPPLPSSTSNIVNQSAPPVTQKRKKLSDSSVPASKRKKEKPGQTKLSAFFAKPSASISSNPTPIALAQPETLEDASALNQLDSDYRLALQLSASQENILSQSNSSSSSALPSQSKTAWTQLMAPIKPPKCIVHDEPTKEFTVNKPGPNKGKNFFICSRPVGPGYDRGKAERLREEVDPQYKCNFFKWASEVKRESLKDRPPQPGNGK